MTPTQFDQWYATPLKYLNVYEHGGFAVLMISLPLAERYFREKSGCNERISLTDSFYDEFIKVFTNLSRSDAQSFWKIYRHGLLHQATFKKDTSPGVISPAPWITSAQHSSQAIITINHTTNEIIVLTKEFSEKILSTIKSDFPSFLAPGAPNHPTPIVSTPQFLGNTSTGSPNVFSPSPVKSSGNP